MNQVIFLECKNCGYALREGTDANQYICDACGSIFYADTSSKGEEYFQVVAGVLKSYNGTSTDVFVPHGVTAIGEGCFQGMEFLERVVLPECIAKIGDEAFCGCTNLKHINFPASLKVIGQSAFKESGVETVELSSVDKIGKDAFMGCQSLQHVILPKNKNIPYERSFKQCASLRQVDCDLHDFCLSFRSSKEVNKKGDIRPTLFDAFQATPLFHDYYEKMKRRECFLCGGTINNAGLCEKCGANYLDVRAGGCYVATAVYGSYNCPAVWTLRRYRDHQLARSWYGRTFIRTYYAISPTLVHWFGHRAWFQNFWRKRLDKLVAKLQRNGVESTPYEDVRW